MTTTSALTPLSGSPFPTVAHGGPEGQVCSGNTLYVALHNAAAGGAAPLAAAWVQLPVIDLSGCAP